MKKQMIMGAALVFVCVVATQGQNASLPMFQLFNASPVSIEAFSRQVVTGKPFSATEERHSLQILGDGTRIETNETNRLFRDDEGRTRIERSNGTILLFDPVEGFTAELNPATRVAVSLSRPVPRAPGEPLESLQLAKVQAEAADRVAAGRGGRGGSGGRGRGAAGGSGDFGRVLTFSGANLTLRFPSEYGANFITTVIPAQTIDGVMAQGTRTTETIAVGKIGNDRPITVVNERWFSNDLQMLVKSSSSDPRFGDTTYQLIDIGRSTPAAWLFQIPADYTIRK